MPERDPPLPHVGEARTVVKKRTRLSVVWIVPIVAALTGVWVAVTRILSEGPKITIALRSAEGLEAGKKKIRCNGVDIGRIPRTPLADHPQAGIATAAMAPNAAAALVACTNDSA